RTRLLRRCLHSRAARALAHRAGGGIPRRGRLTPAPGPLAGPSAVVRLRPYVRRRGQAGSRVVVPGGRRRVAPIWGRAVVRDARGDPRVRAGGRSSGRGARVAWLCPPTA